MQNIIYNNKGSAIYKQVLAVVALLAIVVFVILLRRGSNMSQQATEKTKTIEKQIQEAGIDLQDFRK